jgi:hypothetical protein
MKVSDLFRLMDHAIDVSPGTVKFDSTSDSIPSWDSIGHMALLVELADKGVDVDAIGLYGIRLVRHRGARDHGGRSTKRTLQRGKLHSTEAGVRIVGSSPAAFPGKASGIWGRLGEEHPNAAPGVWASARMEGALTESREPLGGSQGGCVRQGADL